jgi:hypothetical protein
VRAGRPPGRSPWPSRGSLPTTLDNFIAHRDWKSALDLLKRGLAGVFAPMKNWLNNQRAKEAVADHAQKTWGLAAAMRDVANTPPPPPPGGRREPHFQSGGTFRTRRPGGAGLAVLHDRERILTPAQDRAHGGGTTVAEPR